jgi:hypothetical protein
METDYEKTETIKSSDQLKMYLTTKGKGKVLSLKEIKMETRESKYLRMLYAYEKFTDRGTEELAV